MKTECTAHNQFLLGTVASHSGQAAIKDLRGAFATGLWAGTEFLGSYQPISRPYSALRTSSLRRRPSAAAIALATSIPTFTFPNSIELTRAVDTGPLRKFFLRESVLP